MNVRDIDEFMKDVDEFQVDNLEAVEHEERGYVEAVKVKMVKPITGQQETLVLRAWLHREREFDLHAPHPDVPAMQVGGGQWYELEFRVSEQKADKEAVVKLHNLIGQNKVNFREVLGEAYTLDIVYEGGR